MYILIYDIHCIKCMLQILYIVCNSVSFVENFLYFNMLSIPLKSFKNFNAKKSIIYEDKI